MQMGNLIDKMVRAAKLDATLYEEVEADKTAMGQAMTVVILSGLAAGIGTITKTGTLGIISGAIGAIIGWFIWAFLTYWIGTKLLPQPQTEANLGQLLRTIGFASSPGLIRVLGIIPGFRDIIFFASSIWMLIAMVIAVRQALDYTNTGRAIGVCIIGWLIQFAILLLFVGLKQTGV